MKNKPLLLILLCAGIAMPSLCVAATIPAGTVLNVRTVNALSSRERVGRIVKAELAQDVAIKGNVVLKAGTPVSGVVETSIGDYRRSSALSVNLKDVSVNGKTVPIKTTGAFKLKTTQETKRGVAVNTLYYTFPHGTQMTFRLAQPLNL
jgi:hypothetical protein